MGKLCLNTAVTARLSLTYAALPFLAIAGLCVTVAKAQPFVVNEGKFTNVYVYPNPNQETWDQHLARVRPGDGAQFSRAAIDRFTDQLLSPGWPSFFDALFPYNGIRPPQFFGSKVASQKCVDAALQSAYKGVIQRRAVATLANCHEDGKDPSPQVNLIFSPDMLIAHDDTLSGTAPDLCTVAAGYHGWALGVPNFAVLPTSTPCAPSFDEFTRTMSHEIVEIVSDPAQLGITFGTEEISDICRKRADAFVSFKGYSVSRYWSDSVKACEPRLEPPVGSAATTWVLGEGTPLGTLGGNTTQIGAAVPAARVSTDAPVTQLLLLLQTGPLRGGADNLDVTVNFVGGSQTQRNINEGREWRNGETHRVQLEVPSARVRDITGITIASSFESIYYGTACTIVRAALVVSYPVNSRTYGAGTPAQTDWLDVSGGPLWRFTKNTPDGPILSVPFWPRPNPQRASALDLVVYTGGDDLRSDSHPDVYVRTATPLGSAPIAVHSMNGSSGWNDWSIHSVPIAIPPGGISTTDIASLDLIGNMGGGSFPFTTGDNWNVNRIRLVATLADDLAATFVSQSVPPRMVPGQRSPVSVTMLNTGNATWMPGAQFRLGSQNPQDNDVWQVRGRAPVPGGIIPGTAVSFDFTVTAPATPGVYNFQWRMVQDGVAWFGESTPNLTIIVEPAECAGLGASVQSDNSQIKALLDEWKTLDIKFPGDKIRIGEIKDEIATLKEDIKKLEAQQSAIGCQK
jgi:hypothetical protein